MRRNICKEFKLDPESPKRGFYDGCLQGDCTSEHLGEADALRAHPQRSLHPTVVFVHGQPALSHEEPGAFLHGPRPHLRTNEIALMTKRTPEPHEAVCLRTYHSSPHTPPLVSGTSSERIQRCHARCEAPTLDPNALLHCGVTTTQFTSLRITFLGAAFFFVNLHFT